MPRTGLEHYRRKRDFAATPEPSGQETGSPGRRFVVQKHAATRLHFDFRLEWQGVLLSWAVTRGPSADSGQKRLAVRTEDHPVSYAGFEGTIPAGQYGGGTVMLWDNGLWAPTTDMAAALDEGKLKFVLDGARMRGAWTLVRMRAKPGDRRENWLLIKERDAYVEEHAEGLTRRFDTSVATGRSMEAIAKAAPAEAPPPADAEPPAFRPIQLATLRNAPPEGEDWLHEVKFDGFRCLAAVDRGAARLYSRSGLDWTHRFAALVPAVTALRCDQALIDGEVIAPQGGFSNLQARLKQGGALRLMAFDLLQLDGEDLGGLPIEVRKDRLEALLKGADDVIAFSTHIRGQGVAVFAGLCGAGQEGMISKRCGAPYRPGRGLDWIKAKCARGQEFVIGGVARSTVRSRPFASLLMGTFEDGILRYRGRVGAGLGAEEFAVLERRMKGLQRKRCPFETVPKAVAAQARWLEPVLLAEVRFADMTAEGQIRQGVYLGLRDDKAASEVTMEDPAKEAGKAAPATVKGVRITHPDRKVYKDADVSKIMVARYYAQAAGHMLPLSKARPMAFVRCPDGTGRKCFFQKHRSDGFPAAVGSVAISDIASIPEELCITSAQGLVAAVQMGTIEFHIWGSDNAHLETPDRMVFDLDPDERVDFCRVKAAAEFLRDRLERLGLASAPMLTGGKGIHVIVPLKPKTDWDTVKLFSKSVAVLVERGDPGHFTARMAKAGRKDRIFVDWLRNERGATAVAPYSLRARPGAPVAVPVTWDELDGMQSAAAFDITTMQPRLDRACPFRVMSRRAVTLGARHIDRLETAFA